MEILDRYGYSYILDSSCSGDYNEVLSNKYWYVASNVVNGYPRDGDLYTIYLLKFMRPE